MAQHPTGKRFVCLLATLLLLFMMIGQVSADSGGTPLEQVTNGYHVNLVFEEPAKVGSNNIVVKLRSEAGVPINGADVQIEVAQQSAGHKEGHVEASDSHENTQMDMGSTSHADASGSHNDMNMTMAVGTENHEAMNNETHSDEHAVVQAVTLETGHEPGEYHGSVVLPKSGNWQINVHFKHQNEENKAVFPVAIAAGFPKAGILGGFLSVNLAVIAAAAVLKRKTAAAKITETIAPAAVSIERNR